MPKTLTLRIDNETYKSFLRMAKAEKRSLANFIETTVKAHVRESAFADDSEMAEILAKERLVERLKRGSTDAKRRKGKLIRSIPDFRNGYLPRGSGADSPRWTAGNFEETPRTCVPPVARRTSFRSQRGTAQELGTCRMAISDVCMAVLLSN